MKGTLNILGSRGVPAAHGGFETLCERLSLHLVAKGWQVNVYCQAPDDPRGVHEDDWRGVRRVFVPGRGRGAVSTVSFDWGAVRDVVRRPGVDLVLGYNTAAFNLRQRWRGRQVVINMDGIEWRRDKWSLPEKAWLRANERIAARLGSVLIADHPAIAAHLASLTRRPIVTIPYGADAIADAPVEPLRHFGIEPGQYDLAIARFEPENQVLEIARAHACASEAGDKLVLVGGLDAEANPYHAAIRDAAGTSTLLPGAIYDAKTVQALRFHARLYLHGHRVGGTNPSLVEALGAGNAILAHDNPFNRVVAGDGQHYFRDEDELAVLLARLRRDETILGRARLAARERHRAAYLWTPILSAYEDLLRGLVPEMGGSGDR